MPEKVVCGECGASYDSEQQPFCPRCGGTRNARAASPGGTATGPAGNTSPAASARGFMAASADEKRRKRVRAGGAVLLSVGALFLLLFGATLVAALTVFSAPYSTEYMPAFDGLMAGAGGDIAVTFMDGDEPLAFANVSASSPDGTHQFTGVTDPAGQWRNSTFPSAMVVVNATLPEGSWTARFVTFPGSELNTTVDVQDDATQQLITFSAMPSAFAGYVAFMTAFAALMVAGGIAALKMRWRGLALAGAGTGVVPGLLLLVASLSPIALLFAALLGYAFWAIFQGRDLME